MIDRNDTRLVFLSEVTASTPKDGAISLVDRWWCYMEGEGLILWRDHPKSKHVSPQCNHSEAVTRMLQKRLYSWADVKLVPVVYLGVREYEGYVL